MIDKFDLNRKRCCIKRNRSAEVNFIGIQEYFFNLQKTATAVAHCKRGKGVLKINGRPIEQMEPEILRFKVLVSLIRFLSMNDNVFYCF